METLHVIKNIQKIPKKQKGFSLMEGMFALLLFGSLIILDYRQNNEIEIFKKAKIYSDQTYAYANQFTNYLNSTDNKNLTVKNDVYQNIPNLNIIKKQLIQDSSISGKKSAMKIISLNNLDGKSIFQQYPCLLLYYDNNAGQNEMMGLLYYAGGNSNLKSQDEIVLKAINKNSVYNVGYFSNNSKITTYSKSKFNSNMISNNGFIPNQTLINYIKNNACIYNGKSYFLSDNSLMLNLQMMTEFNDKLISVSGLQRTTDQTSDTLLDESGTTNKLLLPGHIFNNNTLKSGLQVTNQLIMKKSTVNSQENNPNNYTIKLSGTTNKEMLNFGQNSNPNDNNTAFIVNSIKSNTTVRVGTSCDVSEIGKVAVSGAETITQGGKIYDLARNIVTCSKNTTLCPTGYCYLAIKQTKFTFNNPNGLEDANGFFRCPSYAPYVSAYTTSQGTPNVDVFRNIGGITTANSQLKNVHVDNGNSTWSDININPSNSQSLSRYYGFPTGGKWAFVNYMNFSDENIVHGTRDNLSYANVQKINGNTTLSVSSTWSNCSNICPNLNSKYGASWVDATTIYHVAPGRADINGTPVVTGGPSATRCTCAKMGETGNDYYYGLAIIDYSSVHILAVTCSNYPTYQL